MGLFASRSPHRPNFLGMSVVRYLGLRRETGKVLLDISELDLLEGTPIVDIKPYVPYSDSIENAGSGFVRFAEETINVSFTGEAEAICLQYKQQKNRDLRKLIAEVLAQDPRPASQRGSHREYGMLLWNMNVRWRVDGAGFTVFSIQKKQVKHSVI